METRKTVKQLSSGKGLGAHAIPAEVYEAGRLPMAEKTDRVVSLYVGEGGYPTKI